MRRFRRAVRVLTSAATNRSGLGITGCRHGRLRPARVEPVEWLAGRERSAERVEDLFSRLPSITPNRRIRLI